MPRAIRSPERLLKDSTLLALYSLRANACEMLDYNIPFRFFLEISIGEAALNPSGFSRVPDGWWQATAQATYRVRTQAWLMGAAYSLLRLRRFRRPQRNFVRN